MQSCDSLRIKCHIGSLGEAFQRCHLDVEWVSCQSLIINVLSQQPSVIILAEEEFTEKGDSKLAGSLRPARWQQFFQPLSRLGSYPPPHTPWG